MNKFLIFKPALYFRSRTFSFFAVLALFACPVLPVAFANTAPIAVTTRAVCAPNSSNTFFADYYDADAATQTMTFSLVDNPLHGTMTVSGNQFQYTPSLGFTGEDTFTYLVNDGITNSPPCTGRIQVRADNDRAGGLVILVVNDQLLPNISVEVERLKADLINEGYTAKIKSWTNAGSSPSQLWSYLHTEFINQTQWLAGAVLIGDLPKAKTHGTYTELVYWNMDYFQTSGDVVNKHIWVSRINSDLDTYGSEVTLLKRAFDANHAYRTGMSRLPQTAYRYKNPEWWKSTSYLSNAWPMVEQRGSSSSNLRFLSARTDLGSTAGADCYVKGGDMFEEESHGDVEGYMGNYGWLTYDLAFRNIVQVRSVLVGSCLPGVYGGIANEQIFTRGGGSVFAISCSGISLVGETVISQNANTCAILGRGESWGTTLVRAYCLGGEHYTTFFGDLSMGVNASPSNALPSISLSVSNPSPKVGEQVTFSAVVSDSDAAVTNSPYTTNEFELEWFLDPQTPTATSADCYDEGRGVPSLVTRVGHDNYLTETNWETATRVYSAPRSYTVRAEVMDEWMARGWSEKTITIQPDFTKAFRFDCGGSADITDADGVAWLYDTLFTAGSYGWTTPSGVLDSLSSSSSVAGTAIGAVFQTAAAVPTTPAGCPSYKVTIPNGVYLVKLGFADLWSSGPGQRLINVYAEGRLVMYGYDAYADAGAATAVIKTIPVKVSDGELTLRFERNVRSLDDAFINSIEIVPPAAGINYSPVVCAGADFEVLDADNNGSQSVTLSAVNTYDVDGTIVNYQWSESGNLLASGSNAVINLPVGEHLIHLAVTDNSGNTNSDDLIVRVTAWGATDYFTQLFSSGNFDLSQQMITFTPDGSPNFYSVAITPISGFQSPTSLQTYLPLLDDGSAMVSLVNGQAVSLYGQTYNSFYVNANGNITFDSADATPNANTTTHFAKKRVAAFFQDLNPFAGGTVSSRQYADRVAVTWQNVPEFNSTNKDSFQVEMFYDGRIRISFLKMDSINGLVGLSRGAGLQADFTNSDFTSYAFNPDVPAVYTATDPGEWEDITWQPGSSGKPVPGSLTTLIFSNSTAISSTNWLAIFNLNQLRFENQAVKLGGEILVFDGQDPLLTVTKSVSCSIANELALNQNLVCNVSGSTLTVNGLISGQKALTKTGAGMLTLNPSSLYYSANTYSGGTIINSGRLSAGNSGALGYGDVIVANGAQLSLAAGGIVGNNITISGSGLDGGAIYLTTTAGTRSLLGSLTLAANAKITAPNTVNMNLNINGPLNLGPNILTISRGTPAVGKQDWAINGGISGLGGLVYNVSTNSSLTLAGENTFSGETIKNGAATLVLNHPLALQSSTLKYNAGYLHFGGSFNAYTIGGLGGSNGIALVNGSGVPILLSVGNNNDDTVYGGTLSGSGGLNKIGSGTLTLLGTNTYSGDTTVSNGMLTLTHAECLSSNTTIRLWSGAGMELAYSGTNMIHALYVDGQPVFAGVYGGANLPGQLSGAGYLKTIEPAGGYQAWAAAITNGMTGDGQCATDDGYPNLLKYATGSSPTQSDTLARMEGVLTNGLFAFRFHRNPNASDVTLVVEASDDLNVWSGIATNTFGSWGGAPNVTEAGASSPVTVTVWDAANSPHSRFMRLRVTRP